MQRFAQHLDKSLSYVLSVHVLRAVIVAVENKFSGSGQAGAETGEQALSLRLGQRGTQPHIEP